MICRKRIECIDYFKGLSILCVICYHLISLYMKSIPGIIKYAANAGSSGVLIFFFCSGFNLYYSDFRKHRRYIEFLKDKIKKIYFPYIVIVFVSSAIPFIEEKDRIMAIFSHVFLFRTFSLKYFNSFGGHFWFISTIFQLYILFYFLKYILDLLGETRFTIIVMLTTIIYVVILSLIGMQDNMIFIRLFPKYIFEFGMGMVFAKYYIDGKFFWRKIKLSYYFISGIIGVLIYGLSSQTSLGRLLNDLPAFIGVICLFYWLYINGFAKAFFNRLGVFSFEWYLTHMLIFSIVFHFAPNTIFGECICFVFALTISGVIAVIYSRACKTLLSIFK